VVNQCLKKNLRKKLQTVKRKNLKDIIVSNCEVVKFMGNMPLSGRYDLNANNVPYPTSPSQKTQNN
jgi:hypothetical protein